MQILSNLSLYGTLGLNSVADANTDTDKFLVIDSSGIVKYRTGAELYNDIGAGGAAAYTSVLQHTVKAGVALTKGQAVYVTSADGTNMIVGKASNASEATSSKTLGLIVQDLAINDQGFVITEGLLAGLDTSTAAAGDPVWLGTDGNLIYGLLNKPYAPDHLVFIGIVTRAQQNNGEIFVKVQNGFELQELHNVQITSTPSDNAVLAYETSTSLYKMKSIPTLLGYTPVTNARSITINGTTYDLSADRSWSVGTHTGNLTTGYVPKATGATTLTDSLIYDNGSGIGINTSSPYESSAFKLDVNGGLLIKNTSGTTAQLILINSNPATGGNNGFVQLSAGGNTETAFGQWQTYYGMSVAAGALRLQPAGGQVLIGTTTTSAFLTDINGTLRVSGQLTLGSTISNNTYVYTMPGASGTLALVSQIPSLSGYLTIASADATYLTQSSAASIYLSQTSASNTYLTISGAASTYLSQASASNTYLTISGASSIYLSQTSASNTYLSINSASSIYLSQTSASNTYLTINNAASTYVSLTGSYANPSWITSLGWSKITGAPAFITSYTETDTLATVTARGASTTTRTTFTEVGATRAGSDTVAVGPWFRWTNVAEDRQMLVQLNASNGLTYWSYNGSAWATALVLTQAGAATFSSSITTTGASIGRVVMDYDGTDSWFRMQSGNRMRITTTGGTDFIIPNTGNMTYNGNTVWHSGNLTNLNQLTNGPGYITSYTETDTLATVTARGGSTSSALYLSGAVNVYNTDGNDFRLYHGGTASGSARVYYHQPSNQLRIYATAITSDATTGIGSLALYNGSAYKIVLTEGNYNSYSPTLTGGGASGTWGISITGNAATLGGYGPNQTGGAYNIVQRDANGYIQNSYFYMSGGGSERNSSGLGYIAGFNSSDYYVRSYNSTAVASFLGLGSMAYASTGSYLPLSGGTISGTVTINGAGAHPLAISSSQRYQLQVRNTNNSVNSGYGWWWFMDTNFNMGFHADGAADRLTLTRDGNFSVSGTISTSSNIETTGGSSYLRVSGITNGSFIELSGNLPGYTNAAYPVIKSAGTIHFANNNKYSAFLEGDNTYFGILDNTITTRVFLATSGTTYFTGGNVAIGNTTADFGLHVNRNQNQVAGFQSPNANTWVDIISTAGTWSMGATASNTWAIYQRGAANATRFEVGASSVNTAGTMYAAAFRGNANVSGTGEAIYAPAGLYSTGTNWLYGTMYLNVNSINDTADIRTYNSGYSFRARYTAGSDIYHSSLNWYGLQLGNNGDNYIIGGRTATGGNLTFYVNNTSDFTSINGVFAAKMHSTGRTSFGQNSDNGYQVQVYGSLYSSDWIRVAGGQGLYFESYGGGWHMTESSYVRSYNGKSLHMNYGSIDYVGSLYIESGGQGVHLQGNSGSYGSLQVTSSRNGWSGIRFTASNVNIMANSNEVGFYTNGTGWQFLWAAGTAYVYKGGTGGGTQATVLDSSNYSSWAQPASSAINTSNISSQSVSYASSTNLLNTLSNYVWSASTLPSGYNAGIQTSFVSSSEGFPSYGSVLTNRTYTGSQGGTLQLYTPYGPAYGGTRLGFRSGIYETSEWSGWKYLLNDVTDPYAANMNQYVRTTDSPTFNNTRLNGNLYMDISAGGNSTTIYLTGDSAAHYIKANSYWVDFVGNGNEMFRWYNTTTAGYAMTLNGSNNLYVRGDIYVNGNGNTTGNAVIHSGNIGSQSVSYASNSGTLGGYGGSNFLGKNGNSYYQADTWIQLNGAHGLYAPSYNGAHWLPNTVSSYTTWRIAGSRNSYSGIYDDYSGVNMLMFDSGGNGGAYRENNSRWYWYYHLGNACMGINTSSTSSSYAAYIGGTLFATGDVIAYSDARKKTNIVTIDNALEKVTSLRGVFYDRVDEKEKGRQLGVIAQEVNKIVPEAVSYAEDIDEYGVKYGNLGGLFIEAFKEQQKKIDAQDKVIEELKSIISGITK